MNSNDYGSRLHSAMMHRSISREELASSLGISVQAVGQVLTGKTKAFSALNHALTCRLLQCDDVWLASGQAPAKPDAPTEKHPRQTLAANINSLINSQTPQGDRRSVRAWATKKGLDVRLVDRLTKGEHSITIDKLQEVATALDIKPWQLLKEDLDHRF